MNALRKNRLLLFLSVVAICLAIAAAFHRREPSYDGRGLSDWLKDLLGHRPEEILVRAQEAVAKIGTNAIPLAEMSRRGIESNNRIEDGMRICRTDATALLAS